MSALPCPHCQGNTSRRSIGTVVINSDHDKIQKLTAENKKLVEALEWYLDLKNWEEFTHVNHPGEVGYLIGNKDLHIHNYKTVPGKRARKVLAELKE